MPAKLFSGFVRVVAVVFTSLLAPFVVGVAVKEIKREDVVRLRHVQAAPMKQEAVASATPTAAAISPVAQSNPAPPRPLDPHVTKFQPPATLRFVVQGSGKTSQEAVQDALRKGLSRAIATEVNAATWTKSGPVLVEKVARDSAGIVRGWRELAASKEWKVLFTLHHKDIEIEVDRGALSERLGRIIGSGDVGEADPRQPAGFLTQVKLNPRW